MTSSHPAPDSRPRLSVVVPTYNERERLSEFVETVLATLHQHGVSAEVVIVDDNSPDGTGALADELAATHPVTVVHRAGKLGLGSAVVAGFGVARGAILGVMDADMSHPPEYLPRLIDAFDRTGFAPSLANREFFENAFAKLAGNGVLVINLAGEKETYAGLIGEAMLVFDDQVIVISVPDDGNHILYAFKERHFEPRWRWLHNFAKELRANYGLDFPAFVQKMERSTKLGLARREAIRGR